MNELAIKSLIERYKSYTQDEELSQLERDVYSCAALDLMELLKESKTDNEVIRNK
jgi:hypothetical protein